MEKIKTKENELNLFVDVDHHAKFSNDRTDNFWFCLLHELAHVAKLKIVHYYDKIDLEQVYAIFKGKLQTFDSFRFQIEKWINLQPLPRAMPWAALCIDLSGLLYPATCESCPERAIHT